MPLDVAGNHSERPRLPDGSGVNREVHAPFCERPGVKLPRPTHLCDTAIPHLDRGATRLTEATDEISKLTCGLGTALD